MRKTTTKDSSVTLYNEQYEEHYHSVSGAVEEAVKKFVEPCRIKKGMKVLDICFGLGYNSAAAIDASDGDLEIVALEKEIPVEIEELNPKLNNYHIIKETVKSKDLCYNKGNFKLKIIIGDATQTIKTIKEKFDAVFLDPFSPKKNPELWTEEFFSEIKKRMKKDAILATYSCARIVRDNLKKAGFAARDGPCIGRKAPSTIATIINKL